MNPYEIQQCLEEMRREEVTCPKPRRIAIGQDQSIWPFRWQFGNQTEMNDLKAGAEILDIIMTKDGCGGEHSITRIASSPPFFSGSPPTRVANPLVKDERFREDNFLVPFSLLSPPCPHVPSSPRKGGPVHPNFGNKSMVRIEGFDCLNRDHRNCGIPALA
ncbi:hypothetical protein MLD38_040419 [Melastoma candidum]|uniref:Uncharacterized protein n=1 Tax=Melastoma candidum TaxID=119954 RepID=A0ACB9L6A9_9MYRT|nr:hypothetical protein MLD38_040419 [Melastoma candidum]